MLKIKLSTTHSNGSIITYSAPVIATRVKDRAAWVQIPARVRELPFPPFDGKRVVAIKADYAAQWTVTKQN